MSTWRQWLERNPAGRGEIYYYEWAVDLDKPWDAPQLPASVQSSTQGKPVPAAELLDYAGLAAKLGTSEGWVRRNARRTYTRDPIPSVRLGKNVRFDWMRVQEWVKRREA